MDSPATRVEELAVAVAGQVRALRTARGWSLEELAGRAGVSKGMLVQIEGARTNPSIGTLCRIADAFGVTVAGLLADPVKRSVRITAAADAPALWQGSKGGLGRLIASTSHPDFVELWEWRLAPGERHDSTEHAPGTLEFLHVLTATVTVTVDRVDYQVNTGETIQFLADRPHGYRNESGQSARLLMVVVMPPGEWDRRV